MDPLTHTPTRSLSSRLEAGAVLPRRVRNYRDKVPASCPSQGVTLPSLPQTHAAPGKTDCPKDTADRTTDNTSGGSGRRQSTMAAAIRCARPGSAPRFISRRNKSSGVMALMSNFDDSGMISTVADRRWKIEIQPGHSGLEIARRVVGISVAGSPFDVRECSFQRPGCEVIGAHAFRRACWCVPSPREPSLATENAIAARMARKPKNGKQCRAALFVTCGLSWLVIRVLDHPDRVVMRTGATMLGTSSRPGRRLSGLISIRIALGTRRRTHRSDQRSGWEAACSSLIGKPATAPVCPPGRRMRVPTSTGRNIITGTPASGSWHHTDTRGSGRHRTGVPKFVDDQPHPFAVFPRDHLILENARIAA